MVEDVVSAERLAAGSRYLGALEQLGFTPDGAMWSVRKGEPETLELSLFSGFVDRVGSGRMFEVLFEAHEKARTPREFDPWLVGLYSPDQLLYKRVQDFAFSRPGQASIRIKGGYGYMDGDVPVEVQEFDIERVIDAAWVYRPLSGPRVKSVEVSRRWKRFERAVAQAA